MRAVCWYGSGDIRVESVPDPEILNPHDAILRVSLTAICGSDLHIYNGFIPGMQKGDILGHEFMGEVVEVGRKVEKLRKGDRVVVPFTICCGKCHFCATRKWSLCDNTNPNAGLLNKLYGASGAGLFYARNGRQAFNQDLQLLTQERFAAGEAHFLDAQAHRQPNDSLNLLKG